MHRNNNKICGPDGRHDLRPIQWDLLTFDFVLCEINRLTKSEVRVSYCSALVKNKTCGLRRGLDL